MKTLKLDQQAIEEAIRNWPDVGTEISVRNSPAEEARREVLREPVLVVGPGLFCPPHHAALCVDCGCSFLPGHAFDKQEESGVEEPRCSTCTRTYKGQPNPCEGYLGWPDAEDLVPLFKWIARLLSLLATLAEMGYEILLEIPPEDIPRAEEFFRWLREARMDRYGSDDAAVAVGNAPIPIPGITACLRVDSEEDVSLEPVPKGWCWNGPSGFSRLLALPFSSLALLYTGKGPLSEALPEIAEQLGGGVVYERPMETMEPCRDLEETEAASEARQACGRLGLRWLDRHGHTVTSKEGGKA